MARSSTSFHKGETGNKGGRPKQVASARALAQAQIEPAMRVLVDLMENSDPRLRLYAANAILDRAIGRPAVAEDDEQSSGKILKIIIPDYRRPRDQAANQIAESTTEEDNVAES